MPVKNAEGSSYDTVIFVIRNIRSTQHRGYPAKKDYRIYYVIFWDFGNRFTPVIPEPKYFQYVGRNDFRCGDFDIEPPDRRENRNGRRYCIYADRFISGSGKESGADVFGLYVSGNLGISHVDCFTSKKRRTNAFGTISIFRLYMYVFFMRNEE